MKVLDIAKAFFCEMPTRGEVCMGEMLGLGLISLARDPM